MKEAQGARRRQELGEVVTRLCEAIPGLEGEERLAELFRPIPRLAEVINMRWG